MAISLATPRYVFGSSVACFPGALAYADNQAIVYPAGSSLVAYNIDQREQKILMGSEHSRPVTALAITPNRRFIAVAEMGITDSETDRASIIIYDVQARRDRVFFLPIHMYTVIQKHVLCFFGRSFCEC